MDNEYQKWPPEAAQTIEDLWGCQIQKMSHSSSWTFFCCSEPRHHETEQQFCGLKSECKSLAEWIVPIGPCFLQCYVLLFPEIRSHTYQPVYLQFHPSPLLSHCAVPPSFLTLHFIHICHSGTECCSEPPSISFVKAGPCANIDCNKSFVGMVQAFWFLTHHICKSIWDSFGYPAAA